MSEISHFFLVVGAFRLQLIAASLGLAQLELQYPTVLGRRFQFALNFTQFRRLVITKRISKLYTRPSPGTANKLLNIIRCIIKYSTLEMWACSKFTVHTWASCVWSVSVCQVLLGSDISAFEPAIFWSLVQRLNRCPTPKMFTLW